MDSVLCVQTRFGQHTPLLTTAAVPLTGWTAGRPGPAVQGRAA